MSNQSTPNESARKPRKPNPNFPLSPHRNGQWFLTKRINGIKEFFYFGRWTDDVTGDRAFAAWKIVADDLRAGRRPQTTAIIPPVGSVGCTELAERFVDFAEARMVLKEIGSREFGDIRLACMGHFLDAVGETTPTNALDQLKAVPGRSDLITPLLLFREHLARRMGPYAMHRNFDKVRRMLKWGHKQGLIPRPMHEHDALKRLKKRVVKREVRKREAEHGVPIYSAAECVALVNAAVAFAERKSPLLAMILLGLNGGCDAAWLSDAPLSAFDLDAEFVDWVRPKTEELCRFPLWPATVFAIREWLPHRPLPRDSSHADRMFLTVKGNLFVRVKIRRDADGNIGDINPDDALGKEFVKVEKAAQIPKHQGRRFKALRRTHSTAANNVLDRDARRMVMGHGFEGMDPHYVRGMFPPARLKAVTDHVASLLLGSYATVYAFPRKNG